MSPEPAQASLGSLWGGVINDLRRRSQVMPHGSRVSIETGHPGQCAIVGVPDGFQVVVGHRR